MGPGRIAWFDITTSDLPQSREFYGKLFDWIFTPVEGTDQAVEIVARGEAIGTLRTADGKISPFNGVVYVQVADIEASCGKASGLGGTVAPGFPFDLPQRYRSRGPRIRSDWASRGHVLQNAAPAGSASRQVTTGK